jgi:hypothetical protein
MRPACTPTQDLVGSLYGDQRHATPALGIGFNGVVRYAIKNRGRLDFWTLGNEIAGRSRRYRRVVIDEAAFAKDGDNKVDGSMMEIWEKAIKPTLFDYGGEVLICSNSAGKNTDNFFYKYLYRPELRFRRIPCNNHGQSDASEAGP